MSPLTPPTDPTDPSAYATWLAYLDANRLTPLAHKTLADTDLAPEPRAHLAAAYAESRAAWLQRKHETLSLLAILAQPPAIPVILLKGIALAFTLYPDPALRPMNDVDVLTPDKRLPEAAKRLLAKGYPYGSNLEPGFDSGPSHHLNFVSSNSAPPVRFELHSTIVRLPTVHRLDCLQWLWQGCEQEDVQGRQFKVLSPTATLLIASMHTMQAHGKSGALVSWIYDVDLLWRRRGDDIVWSETLQWAHRLDWESALHAMLVATIRCFDTSLPPQVMDWLNQDPKHLRGYDAVQRLASPDHTRSEGMLEILRVQSTGGRWHYLTRTLVPHPTYMRQRYPIPHPALLPLTYPYRWLDITADLIRTTYRALRRRLHTL